MRKAEALQRFGPGLWATVRDTGEHVKIEFWSNIAASYRARSGRKGVLFLIDEELDEVVTHPERHLGKDWNRCSNSACGAPLTPGLVICETCGTQRCTCGHCACPRRAASTTRTRAVTKRTPQSK